ncbi:MAG: recombinase RecJ [Candidatus Wallbacteria bacterium HGW-Wallbacteria-1]|uniref:Recombinase RecJ n=1 Tax=Candidatus Wallbacteria bacterium HGW-Wallbacteria-1 TaxID=2013854 RepID=A0A2N1PMZ3_9BACT|nr:MAG: recombinase RecJ [Candidatus Wallbacteria bacterium HGW-Wallbacteria-1]
MIFRRAHHVYYYLDIIYNAGTNKFVISQEFTVNSFARQKILSLIDSLGGTGRVFVQTHDFPDPDALASAFALQKLFKARGLNSTICFEGFMERGALKEMCSHLGIEAFRSDEVSMVEKDRVVIVDGCKHNRNVTDLPGEEVAVIDHHEVERPEDVSYCDIRPNYGSTSTIIYDYYLSMDEIPDRNSATAMMIGLLTDTAHLSRGCCREDVEAFAGLWNLADMDYVRHCTSNNLSLEDLSFISDSIGKLKTHENFGFIYLENSCARNLLGIMGDFFLGMKELDFVVLASRHERGISLSARSELRKWNAASIVRTALQGRGSGGGHADMAGGFIPGEVSEDELFNSLKSALFSLNF